MSYGDRLKKIRRHLELSQDDFAKSIGVSNKQTISDVENDKQKKLNIEHENMLIEKYMVSKKFLILGEGAMFVGDCNVMQNDNIISLPYYPEEYMSAGGGAYPSLMKSEPLSISVEFIKTVLGIDIYEGMFVMNVSGDSMEPALKDRSLIVVNPIANDTHIIKDGAVYAVQFGNMMLVKRVSYNPASKEFTLISDNPKYPPIIIKNHTDSQENLVFIGRIVGCFDRV